MRIPKKAATVMVSTTVMLASSTLLGARSPSGAIFTTTPDGSIVNENVHYEDKREVYLDGGPPPNAPQHAAGLDDGCYVFQITDPSGHILLSADPSRCRVVMVQEGVITHRVRPVDIGTECDVEYSAGTNNWKDNGSPNKGPATWPCHVDDDPNPTEPFHPTDPGVMGASGQHDTNVDVDHGEDGAIVVQMMPYGTTPNPGNVYKAWMEPIDDYLTKSGQLDDIPAQLARREQKPHRCPDFCAAADEGFGPPRAESKTDNFKVKFAPPRATLEVRKFNDCDADGVWDEEEPEIGVGDDVKPGAQCVDEFGKIATCSPLGNGGGWPIDITDPTVTTNRYYTVVWLLADPAGIWTVLDVGFGNWFHTATYLDGVLDDATNPIDVEILGNRNEDRQVLFGNAPTHTVTGHKYIDLNANGLLDSGRTEHDGCPAGVDHNDPGCQNVTIQLWSGSSMVDDTTTDDSGYYEFTGVRPGEYVIRVVEPDGFFCRAPTPCEHSVSLTGCEGPRVLGDYDFLDYSLGELRGTKYRGRQCGGVGMEGVTIRLTGTNGLGESVEQTTVTGPDGSYSFVDLVPGSYTVTEESPAGYGQACPENGEGHHVVLESDEIISDLDFGNIRCDGLTPGYWSNWRNHYTESEFCGLLVGTVADEGDAGGATCPNSIASADDYLGSIGCDGGDALHCMRRFLLSNQLTINLTNGDPSLFNETHDGLLGTCRLDGHGDLSTAIQDGLDCLATGANCDRDWLLDIKNRLAAFAELN